MKFSLWILLLTGPLTFAGSGLVLVNQVGYLPDGVKYVYSVQQADSFYVIEKSSGVIFFRGALQFVTSNDPSTGYPVYSGDFSALSRNGFYYVKTSAGDSSFTFSVSDTAFENVLYKSLKGFYYQRCGTALLPQYAGVYARPACHLNDGYFHSTTGKSGFLSETGGWHDAGDFGKYVVNAGISVGTLLMAYEYFPDKFGFDNLNIPESGNSVPDILDEARYEIEWLLKMQDPGGGVYHKLTRENFSSFIMPDKDTGTRYIYQISSTATGDFAAVTALAAKLYSSFDQGFADQCLAASKKAWEFLEQHPSIVPAGGFHNPSGTATGEYGDGSDSDERLWAAAELFNTTGDSVYNTYFITHYNDAGIFTGEMGWQNVRSLAQLTYLFSGQNGVDGAAKINLSVSLDNLCQKFVGIIDKNGLKTALNPGEFYWGSNSEDLNRAIMLIMGYKLSGSKSYYNAALNQLDYVLGVNGKDISYITGTGSISPMHPHHRPSAADGIAAPVPGLLAGGPDQYLDDASLKAAYNSSTPPALCYLDDQNSYASNEIAINWNAPLVFVSGYFTEPAVTGVGKSNGMLPEGYSVYQNYPNPFNPSTVISYRLNSAGRVMLKVFDIMGNEIATLVNGLQSPGLHRVVFDSQHSDQSGQLSSGIYLYTLSAGNFVQTRKMVLCK